LTDRAVDDNEDVAQVLACRQLGCDAPALLLTTSSSLSPVRVKGYPTMDANEIDHETVYRPPRATEDGTSAGPASYAPPPSLLRSTWHGAKTGCWVISYIAGPLAVLGVTFVLSMSVFGLGAGRGWGVSAALPGAIGAYFVFVGYGLLIGAVVGLIGALFRRALSGTRFASSRDSNTRSSGFTQESQITKPLEGASTPPRRRRLWPWLAAGFVLLVLAAAFVAGAYVGGLVDRRLAAATATADRDDPYWRLDDLMAHRDPVPDSENSAIVVAEALALLPGQGVGKDHDRLTGIAENVRLDDALASDLGQTLEQCRPALEIARTVANIRRGRHELVLGPTLIDTPLSETQAARDAARLLTIDAAVRVHNGDADGALESCRAILGVARSIGDEPFSISQIVRIALGEVAAKSARRVLGQEEPSDAALARLQKDAVDEMAQPLLLYGMKGERAVNTELIRRIGAGELPISALSDANFDPNGQRTAVAPWGKLWFDNQVAVCLEWLSEAVAIARRPPAEQVRLWTSWDAGIEKFRHSWLGVSTATLPILSIPGLAASGRAHFRYQANLGTTAILLAAERHRLKTGAWPTSIGEIGPGILANPPVDPYSGQPFRMARRDGQLLIYSIGDNLEDEHGAYEPKRSREKVHDDVGTGAWDVSLRRKPPLAR
jgi:hypothetical protein